MRTLCLTAPQERAFPLLSFTFTKQERAVLPAPSHLVA